MVTSLAATPAMSDAEMRQSLRPIGARAGETPWATAPYTESLTGTDAMSWPPRTGIAWSAHKHHHGHDDDGSGLARERRDAGPDAERERAHVGELVVGQGDDEGLGLEVAHDRVPRDESPADDEHDGGDVHAEHDGARRAWEERVGEHEVHREPRGARRERHEQPREEPLARVRQHGGRGQRGHVAAEADDEGKHRAAVEPEGAHRLVRDDGDARQVASRLERRHGGEHDRHERHEGQHGAHPCEHAVRR